MAKESKYAKFLRNLGFEPYTEEVEAYIADRVERRLAQMGTAEMIQKLSRADRRKLKKITSVPTFGFMPGTEKILTVKDENGRNWSTRKEVDVSLLEKRGFKDTTLESAMIAAAKLPPPPPRRNN